MTPSPGDRNPLILTCLVLAALTLAAFWQVQGHDFLVWDDYEYILENPHVRTGLSLENVLWAFRTTHASYWHPLTWLSHMLDSHLFGLNPGAHHFTNVLIHTANALLLLLLLRQMTGSLWPSAFAAALFALHPLRVESVAWASERKDVLGALFWMLTLWAYIRYVRKDTGTKGYLLALLIFSLGLMAKPMLVTIPFVLLLLDYWPLGRFRPGASGATSPGHRAPGIGRLVMEKVPFLAPVLLSALITFHGARDKGAVAASAALSLGLRAANAIVSYGAYLQKTVWPTDLAFFYPHPLDTLPLRQFVGSLLVLVLISLVAFRYSRRRPYLAVGWLWYLGTLLPVIGLIQVGAQGMADRFTYIPQIGLFIMAAWGLADLLSRWTRGVTLLAPAGLLLLLVLASQTRSELAYWKDGVRLFQRAAEVTSGNYMAHFQLGNELIRRGRIEEADGHFLKALEIKPDHEPSHQNLAAILARQGRIEEALAHYDLAIRIDPGHARNYYDMGNVYANQGTLDRAISAYQDALRRDPDDGRTRNNLGYVLMRQERFEEAEVQFREALRINPGDGRARYNLKLLREHMKEKKTK
ncbi:MAG: tetratricopeptide repeat protein [Deltaproteobacteria bacterium]|nr:tetratricopeptide repeat protein [Deltaproteobacteria bacterium]